MGQNLSPADSSETETPQSCRSDFKLPSIYALSGQGIEQFGGPLDFILFPMKAAQDRAHSSWGNPRPHPLMTALLHLNT